MSEITISWKNKHLQLRASSSDSYDWITNNASKLLKSIEIKILGKESLCKNANILAVGDGLDVVEALATKSDALKDKIRLVYIDPPFNTSADVKCYNDTMNRSMWLSMLKDRLMAVKPHLSHDASVWVHLDDSEVHRARLVMDDIFGENAFIASVIWQKKTTRESRPAFSNNHDTILVYAPIGPQKWKKYRNLLVKDVSALQNRDNDPRGPWADAPFTAPGYRPAQQYPLKTPSGRILTPPEGRSWYATKKTYLNLLKEDRIWFPKNGSGSPRLKLFSDQFQGLVPFTIWGTPETGTNDDAKRHLMKLFPNKPVFDTPKPEQLLERIIHIATQPGDLVIDLFGGSGTTAAVAHKMGRRWILSERNYETVLKYTLPRLQSVLNGSDLGGVSASTGWKNGGDFTLTYVKPRLGRAITKKKLSELVEAFLQTN